MADMSDELADEINKVAESLSKSSEHVEKMADAIRSMQASMRSVRDISDQIGSSAHEQEKSYEAAIQFAEKLISLTAERNQLSDTERNIHTQRNALIDAERLAILEIRKQREQLKLVADEELKAERERLNIRNQEREAENAILEAVNKRASFTERLRSLDSQRRKEFALRGYTYDRTTGEVSRAPGIAPAIARSRMMVNDNGSIALFGMGEGAAIANILSRLGALSLTAGSLAGVGGLVGLIINAVEKKEEYIAAGQRAAQAFDVAGQGGKRFADEFIGMSRAVKVGFYGSAEAVANVSKSFADFSITAREALRPIDGVSTAIGNNLVAATLAADKAFEMAEGTMAKLTGTLTQNFNTSADKAFINLMNVGTSAKEAGLNVSTFMQQISSLSATLSVLNLRLEGVGETQLGITKQMMGEGFGRQFSFMMSSRGMANVAGAVANMGEGLAAILGQRMGMQDPMEALYRLKGGTLLGNNQLEFDKIIKEMGRLAQENAGTIPEQALFLRKVFGVDASGADAILRAMKEMSLSGGYLSDASRSELASGLQDESQKMSRLVRAAEQIRDGFVDIGIGLLSTLVNIGKATLGMLASIYGTVMEYITKGSQASEEYKKFSSGMLNYTIASSKGILDSIDVIADGVNKIGIGLSVGVSAFNIGSAYGAREDWDRSMRALNEAYKLDNRSTIEKVLSTAAAGLIASNPVSGTALLLHSINKESEQPEVSEQQFDVVEGASGTTVNRTNVTVKTTSAPNNKMTQTNP